MEALSFVGGDSRNLMNPLPYDGTRALLRTSMEELGMHPKPTAHQLIKTYKCRSYMEDLDGGS